MSAILPNPATPIIATLNAVNSYPTSTSCVNNIQGWEATTVSSTTQSVANMSVIIANPNMFLFPKFVFPEPALFVGISVYSLTGNQYTNASATTIEYLQNINQWANFLNPPPPPWSIPDFYGMLANQNLSVASIALQNPAWLPAVSLAPQTAQFAGSDIYALQPNIETIVNMVALQPATWVPGVSFAPQVPLFAGSDVRALYPNNWTLGAPPYLQPPTWIPAIVNPQPTQAAFLDIAALLANQLSLQAHLEDAAIANNVVEQEIVIRRWWRKWSLFFQINVTEALGNVTESVVISKISGTILFVFNKLMTFVDQW